MTSCIGKARDGAALHHVVDALEDRRLVLAGDRAAEDIPTELQRRLAAALGGLDVQVDLAELAGAAGLLLVAVVPFGLDRDRFLVRDLRLLRVDGQLEAVLHLLDHDPQVQVAEALGDELLGLRVAGRVEAGVLFAEPVEGAADLLLVAAGGRLQRQGEHRLGQGGHDELAGDPAVVHEVADLELLELGQGDDIAGDADVDFLGLAALRFEDVAGPHALLLIVAHQVGIGLERAAEDADARVLHVGSRVEGHAEDQARQRSAGVGLQLGHLLAVHELGRLGVDRRRACT